MLNTAVLNVATNSIKAIGRENSVWQTDNSVWHNTSNYTQIDNIKYFDYQPYFIDYITNLHLSELKKLKSHNFVVYGKKGKHTEKEISKWIFWCIRTRAKWLKEQKYNLKKPTYNNYQRTQSHHKQIINSLIANKRICYYVYNFPYKQMIKRGYALHYSNYRNLKRILKRAMAIINKTNKDFFNFKRSFFELYNTLQQIYCNNNNKHYGTDKVIFKGFKKSENKFVINKWDCYLRKINYSIGKTKFRVKNLQNLINLYDTKWYFLERYVFT